MMRTPFGLALPLLIAAAPLAAQQLPPVRPIGPVMQVSPPDLLGSVTTVRPLPGGGAIVNDLTRRQLLLLNPDFTKKAAIADTTPETANSYSGRLAGLIPYRGDSSLFIDPQSLSMLVIDGKGDVARVMAVPRPEDAMFMIGGPFGTPGLDPRGRLVYRGNMRTNFGGMQPPQPGQPFRLPPMPDSAPIYRVDLATRALDTIGYFRIPKANISVSQNDKGAMSISVVTNPMPMVDDWALLPDGRIAIVRGKDYHVEWLELDGKWTSTPKIPYNWERFDDDAKVKFIDSVKTEAEKQRETLNRAIAAGVNSAAPSGGNAQVRFEMRTEGGAAPARATPGVQQVNAPAIKFVDPKDLPDYRSVFRQGAVRADLEGNLWIRTTAPSDAGPVYDVINGTGALVDRVKLPFGRVISGFGRGVVFMGVQDEKGARLEMARLK